MPESLFPSFSCDLDTYGSLKSTDMSCSHNRNRVVSADPTIAGRICWANEESERRRLRREAADDREERGEEESEEEFHDAVTHQPADGERVRREVMGAMLVSITSPTPSCSSSSSDADSFSGSPSPISVYNHTPFNSPSEDCGGDMHMLRGRKRQKSRKEKEKDLNLVRPPPQNPAKLMVPFAPEEGMEEDDYRYLLLARRLAQEALEFDAASVSGDQFPDPDPYSTDEDEEDGLDGDGDCISFTESVFNRQFYKLRQLEKGGGAGSYSGDDEDEDEGDEEDWVNDTFDQWLAGGGSSSSSSCRNRQDEGGFYDNYYSGDSSDLQEESGYEGGDERSLFLDHHHEESSSFLGDLEEEEEAEEGEVEVFPFSPPPTQTTFVVL